jgi:pSer/pThr/pTyr-binding forkhead associated (FHA) protein
MKLIIEDDEGRKTVVPMAREEITIGRQEGNTIRLTERNVSRRHARLLKNDGQLLIEDLGSYNGVRVNGERIGSPTPIKEGDLVEIGDYDLGIQGKFEATIPPKTSPGLPKAPAVAAKPAPAPQAPEPAPAQQLPRTTPTSVPTAGGATAIIRVSDLTKGEPQVEARDLERSEMPRLVGLAGPFRGKELYLMRSEVKLGRTDENDVVVDHQSVSRSHARFVLDQAQWKVVDNKSANGVRVNGEEYAVANLKPGDVVELGHLKFRFCGPGEKFTPPPERPPEDAKPSGGLRPTTAELIAAAQGRAPTQPPSASPKKSSAGVIALVLGFVVVIAGGAYLVLGKSASRRASEQPEGEDAVRLGDAQLKQHHYREALRLYDEAGDSPTPNKKRAADEARGEEAYQGLRSALDTGDADRARNLYDRCATESTYWCQKATAELGDQVRSAYAKKHLGAAAAAKAAGKNDVCASEANAVLSFDAANAEAQQLAQSCSPQPEAQKAAPPAKAAPPPKPAAPAESKEAKAKRLAKASSDKLVNRDFQGAVNDAQAALALSPADPDTLGFAYRSLGYGYAYLNDTDAAKKNLKLFKPYCEKFGDSVCAQVDQFLSR